VPQASRESAGRQQWVELRLEAEREGQVGQPGVTDFGAGRALMKNNGSRRPYIRPLSAGSCISRSKGVKPSRTVGAYEEQDCYVATFGIGMPGISELGRR